MKFEKLFEQYMNEADDGDGKVESKSELKAMATKMAKAAFGDKTDMDKVNGMVDAAIKDNTKDGETDWESAAGQIVGSFNS